MAKLGEYCSAKINRLEYKKQRDEDRISPEKLKQTIDLEQVYSLGRNMISTSDLAIQLNKSRSTIDKWLGTWPEFITALNAGYSETRRALGKVQLDMALSGNPAMMIWLGKQYLGQSDKREEKNTTEISVTVSRAMDELRNIPREALLEAQALLSKPIKSATTDDDDSGAD
jgi:hypothetical protein